MARAQGHAVTSWFVSLRRVTPEERARFAKDFRTHAAPHPLCLDGLAALSASPFSKSRETLLFFGLAAAAAAAAGAAVPRTLLPHYSFNLPSPSPPSLAAPPRLRAESSSKGIELLTVGEPLLCCNLALLWLVEQPIKVASQQPHSHQMLISAPCRTKCPSNNLPQPRRNEVVAVRLLPLPPPTPLVLLLLQLEAAMDHHRTPRPTQPTCRPLFICA